MKVFLDTNVLVSAFASRGICSDVFEVVLLEHDLVIGRHVLQELGNALREKLKLPARRTSEILDLVTGEAAAMIEGAGPVDAKVDAADALVLGEALLGQASHFVTGDAALLKLGAVNGLRIMSPRQFWDTLRLTR